MANILAQFIASSNAYSGDSVYTDERVECLGTFLCIITGVSFYTNPETDRTTLFVNTRVKDAHGDNLEHTIGYNLPITMCVGDAWDNSNGCLEQGQRTMTYIRFATGINELEVAETSEDMPLDEAMTITCEHLSTQLSGREIVITTKEDGSAFKIRAPKTKVATEPTATAPDAPMLSAKPLGR